MDQNEEFQEEEFDLESILNEFRDPAQEPPKALEDDAPPAQESPAAEESAPVGIEISGFDSGRGNTD